jgi:hypothetical protein
MTRVLSAKPSTALRETSKGTIKKNKIFPVLIFIAYSFSRKLAKMARSRNNI